MEIGKDKVVAALKDRVVGSKITTIIACVLAALGAVGLKLENDPSFSAVGQILVQASAFLGHIVLLVAKDKGDA